MPLPTNSAAENVLGTIGELGPGVASVVCGSLTCVVCVFLVPRDDLLDGAVDTSGLEELARQVHRWAVSLAYVCRLFFLWWSVLRC